MHSAKHQYLSHSEGDFEVFAPHGVAPMGVKLSVEEWTFKCPTGAYTLRDFSRTLQSL